MSQARKAHASGVQGLVSPASAGSSSGPYKFRHAPPLMVLSASEPILHMEVS